MKRNYYKIRRFEARTNYVYPRIDRRLARSPGCGSSSERSFVSGRNARPRSAGGETVEIYWNDRVCMTLRRRELDANVRSLTGKTETALGRNRRFESSSLQQRVGLELPD